MVGSNNFFELIASSTCRVGANFKESFYDIWSFQRRIDLAINPRYNVGRRLGWCENPEPVADFKTFDANLREGLYLR
jgi:hypothetical protein